MRSFNHSLYLIPFLSFFLPSVLGFTFSTSTPVQCQNFTIQWSGGTGPYHLSLVPTIVVAGGHIENITIPSGSTEYSFNLEQPAGLDFLVTMSDSTGFGTGGTTSVLTVGSSGDSSCVPTSLNYDFTFAISPDSNPSSCSSMTVTWLENATEPVSLFGMIPHGTAFQLPISQSSTTYDWTVDIRENTQFLLFMSDAGQYQTGGSTPLYRVQGGGNTNCITSSSPTTASGDSMTYATSASSPTASVTGVGGSSQGGSSGGSGGSSKNTGAIVGGAVGGVAFLVLLAVLLFFCIKRRARRSNRSESGGLKSYGIGSAANGEKNGRRSNQIDLAEDGVAGAGLAGSVASGRQSRQSGQVEMNGDVYEPSPFRYPSPPETPGQGHINNGLTGISSRTNGGIQPSNLNTPEMLALASEKASHGHGHNRNSSLGVTNPDSPLNNTAGRTSGETVSSNRNSYQPSSQNIPPALSEGIAETEDSNRATVGHGQGQGAVPGPLAGRMSSIRKTPSSQHIGHPTANAGAGAAGTAMGAGPVANAANPGEARYVQHEDAGVIDLPPRYDQLRTRNPDQ